MKMNVPKLEFWMKLAERKNKFMKCSVDFVQKKTKHSNTGTHLFCMNNLLKMRRRVFIQNKCVTVSVGWMIKVRNNCRAFLDHSESAAAAAYSQGRDMQMSCKSVHNYYYADVKRTAGHMNLGGNSQLIARWANVVFDVFYNYLKNETDWGKQNIVPLAGFDFCRSINLRSQLTVSIALCCWVLWYL